MKHITMAKTVIFIFNEFIKDKVNLDQDRE